MTKRAKIPLTEQADAKPGRASWMEKLRRPGFICLALAMTTLAVFMPVAWQGFVNYDDSDYVTENAHVQSGLEFRRVLFRSKTGHASNWHPLTWLSHMVDCQLFGVKAGGPHLVSVGFHIANTLLLFLLLRRMTGALWRSALVAALFALHPLHVESVAWASERKDVLSAFFFLLTIWAYVRHVEVQSPTSKVQSQATRNTQHATPTTLHATRYYVLSLLFFALGLMSKPMLVTMPFVLLLIDYWPLHRPGATSLESQPVAGLLLLLEKVPFFVLSVASSVITFLVQRKGGAVSTALTFGERVANALVSYVRYIGKTFWPKNLSILYPHPGHWPAWQVMVSAGLLLAVSAAVILMARRRPYLAVGWLWFCGTLIPVIGLIQVGIQSMADRYTYVPLIGLFIMLAWGIDELMPARPWRCSALAIGAALLLTACGFLTERQIPFLRDNSMAYNNPGYYLNNQGRTAEAMENYRLSLKINPAYEDALNNLGYALAGQKKYAEAIPLYEAALRVRPRHAEVHNNLGNALSETGKIDEAIQHYLIALQEKPDHADAHNNLGIALAMKGRLDEAIPHFHEAIRCKPNYASAHSNLGNALAVQHKLDEAIKEYQESLRLKPDDAQAHNNLGNALAEQGKVEAAIEHYGQALRLNADNPEAHFNLALALLRQGKRDEATAHLREALRLKPDYAEAQAQLKSMLGRPRP